MKNDAAKDLGRSQARYQGYDYYDDAEYEPNRPESMPGNAESRAEKNNMEKNSMDSEGPLPSANSPKDAATGHAQGIAQPTSIQSSKHPSDMDESIKKHLASAFSSDDELAGIDFEVSGNTVVLRGFVPSESIREKAEARVREVTGIWEMNNQITVGESGFSVDQAAQSKAEGHATSRGSHLNDGDRDFPLAEEDESAA